LARAYKFGRLREAVIYFGCGGWTRDAWRGANGVANDSAGLIERIGLENYIQLQSGSAE